MITHSVCAQKPALQNTNKLLLNKLYVQTFLCFSHKVALKHISVDTTEGCDFNVSAGRLKTSPRLINLGFMMIWECPLSNVIYESLRWQLWCAKSSGEVAENCDAFCAFFTKVEKKQGRMPVLTIRYQFMIYSVVLLVFCFGKRLNHFWTICRCLVIKVCL